VVFPRADDAPTGPGELARDGCVPLLIAAEVWEPVFAVAHRIAAVFGQPCQKQPSTNRARRWRLNTKSGLPGRDWWRRQPVIRAARRMVASLSSVSLLPYERIAAMTRLRFVLVKTSAIGLRRWGWRELGPTLGQRRAFAIDVGKPVGVVLTLASPAEDADGD
jgi:hypothetical protein